MMAESDEGGGATARQHSDQGRRTIAAEPAYERVYERQGDAARRNVGQQECALRAVKNTDERRSRLRHPRKQRSPGIRDDDECPEPGERPTLRLMVDP